MQRHSRNVHGHGTDSDPSPNIHTNITFQHPFSMMVTGPSASGKTEWTRKLLLSTLKQPPSARIIWCYGQWQPLYEDLQKKLPSIEFVHGIPEYLNSSQFINPSQRNLIVFDDLMTEAKCDQRIADIFTRGSHHRNLSCVYLTQNIFPQGKACRDIALNTQYLVLFNNPIDRQQVATLARRIYAMFMKRFEDATSRPYGYLVVDLKPNTTEQDRLKTDIFASSDPNDFEMSDDVSDVDDANSIESLDDDIGPPGKRRKVNDNSRSDIWNKRFQDPLRQANKERFKANVNDYEEKGFPLDKAIRLAANDDLPHLRKKLRQAYAQFLIDFYELQDDPVQQQILDSARTLRNQHDMSQTDSIRQAVKLRKDLFVSLWPNHDVEENATKEADSNEQRKNEES